MVFECLKELLWQFVGERGQWSLVGTLFQNKGVVYTVFGGGDGLIYTNTSFL
jgi:hypothetical protein